MNLLWHARALEDLAHIRDYIAADNPEAARPIAQRLHAAAQGLREMPEIGRPGRLPGTRELVVAGTPFIIPYRVRDGEIEILRVMHAARRWPDNL
jgi:addiction module RelE/StbE family toxin